MKKQTTADKIRQMTKQNPGMNAKQIADSVGSKIQYVHTVWYLDRKGKKTAVKRKIGRPRKSKNPFTPIVKEFDKRNEEHALRIQLGQYAQLADNRKKEIEELTVIIAYLEDRCARAEGHRGASV